VHTEMKTPVLEKMALSQVNERLLASKKGFLLRGVRHVQIRKQPTFHDT
jgi:hypothetical protein